MIFTVTWAPSAQDELARIWNPAPDQQAIADASDFIDAVLSSNPLTKLTHEHEGLYSFVREPLAILCEVHPDDCLVIVVQVRRV